MTNAEKIAEKVELLAQEAAALGVNFYALVQADPQGGVYYAGDKMLLADLVDKTLPDLRSNTWEHEGVGSISYGL
jgi:hypothetical protein